MGFWLMGLKIKKILKLILLFTAKQPGSSDKDGAV